jgi:hypothetical protein
VHALEEMNWPRCIKDCCAQVISNSNWVEINVAGTHEQTVAGWLGHSFESNASALSAKSKDSQAKNPRTNLLE